jgi:peptide/nickel transport system permease protein
MTLYAIRRLGLALVIVTCAMAVLFGMIHLVPGDPITIALGPRATEAMRAAYLAKMRLDQPVYMQFLAFAGGVLRGDLGADVFSNRSVTTIILEQLPYTLALAGVGLGWAILLGIPLGCYSAMHRNSVLDKLSGVITVGAIAVPSFVVALYSLLLFAVWLRWLPAIGAGEPGDLGDQLMHLILPAFAIGLGWVGYLARLVRASMLEVMGENFIRTARAFGLPRRMIVYRYALKVAILPTVTLLGVGIGNLLSGAVFAEIVFARPGIGKLIYDMALTRNYPVVQGAVLVTTILFVLCALMADLLNAWLDPRVRASL